MDEFVTFGVLMGPDPQGAGIGIDNKGALIIFCPTGESVKGRDRRHAGNDEFGTHGFSVAIIRGNPADAREYVILAKENLSATLKNAVLEEGAHMTRNTSEGFEL